MIAGLCESPLTFQAIIIWRDELNEGKVFLRDIIDLEATYAGPDAKKMQAPASSAPTASRSPQRSARRSRRAASAGRAAGSAAAGAARRHAVQGQPGEPAPTARSRRIRARPPPRADLRRRRSWRIRCRSPRSRPSSSRRWSRPSTTSPTPSSGCAACRSRTSSSSLKNDLAVAGAGAQIQEAQGRDHRRGEVAAAQPGAHRCAGRAALRHQQAPGRPRRPADAARRKPRRRRARTSSRTTWAPSSIRAGSTACRSSSAKGWKNFVARDKDRIKEHPRAYPCARRPRPASRSASSARSCTWCRRASARRARPRRRWWRRTCASSSRSPRNTPTAACSSST